MFRELTKVVPKAEYEDYPRNPEDVEHLSQKEVVEKKQTCRNAGNGEEMKLQLVEVEQEQYACGEVHKLGWELNLQLGIDTARGIQ